MMFRKPSVLGCLSLKLSILGAGLALPLPVSAQTESTDVGPTGVFRFTVTLNGRVTSRGLIDTGATSVVLCARIAKLLGSNTGEAVELNTANEQLFGYRINITSIRIGKIFLAAVPAIAVETSVDCDEILIGMSALRKLRRVVISGDKIVLFGVARHPKTRRE